MAISVFIVNESDFSNDRDGKQIMSINKIFIKFLSIFLSRILLIYQVIHKNLSTYEIIHLDKTNKMTILITFKN